MVDIASVSFDGVDLLLETDRNGVGNWAMGREGDSGAQHYIRTLMASAPPTAGRGSG